MNINKNIETAKTAQIVANKAQDSIRDEIIRRLDYLIGVGRSVMCKIDRSLYFEIAYGNSGTSKKIVEENEDLKWFFDWNMIDLKSMRISEEGFIFRVFEKRARRKGEVDIYSNEELAVSWDTIRFSDRDFAKRIRIAMKTFKKSRKLEEKRKQVTEINNSTRELKKLERIAYELEKKIESENEQRDLLNNSIDKDVQKIIDLKNQKSEWESKMAARKTNKMNGEM